MLADPQRMDALPSSRVPTTLIVGTGGRSLGRRLFGEMPNDGIVSRDEAVMQGVDVIMLPLFHTFIMNSKGVRDCCCNLVLSTLTNLTAG
jgi:hypothetical protein